MPDFSHGKDAVVYCHGRDLSPYLRSMTSAAQRDQSESSVFGNDWKGYTDGQIDAPFTAGGIFDGDADAIDQKIGGLLALPSLYSSVTLAWTWFPYGEAVGNYGYGWGARLSNYSVEAPVDDVVSVEVESMPSTDYGRERVQSLHALSDGPETASGTAASQDAGAGSNNGCTGYLQVPVITAGTVTVTIQDSVDDAVWTDLVNFTAKPAPNEAAGRIEVAGTVARYTRAIWTLNGAGPTEFSASLARR